MDDTYCWKVFFFRAEDGIRDGHVTGVQTCALPILSQCLHGQQTVFDGASKRSPRMLVMKALRQDVAFLAFRPTLPARSSDAQKVLGGASNHSPRMWLAQTLPQVFSVGRVIAVPGRGVLSLWSFPAIPAGVSIYFLHFYNQYSSFVSLFLLYPSLISFLFMPISSLPLANNAPSYLIVFWG